MLKMYTSSNAHSSIPEKPFVKIGEVTNHYSTGTEYTSVYSDEPKNDIPPLLESGNFTLSNKFKPVVLVKGVECTLKLFQKGVDGYNTYLTVPTKSVSINIGDRRKVLNEEEVKNMPLRNL